MKSSLIKKMYIITSALVLVLFVACCNQKSKLIGGFDDNGASRATFSIGEVRTVRFSKGNLQRIEGEWLFAEQQYDYFGTVDFNNNYDGNGDLFRWREYRSDAIKNGGNRIGMWRELTSDEWQYLLLYRKSSTIGDMNNARFAKACVNGVNGLIIFPDNYSHPKQVAIPKIINNENATFSNVYSKEEWSIMEKSGCVFLPAAGCRVDEVIVAGRAGIYWAADVYGSGLLYTLYFGETRLSASDHDVEKWGHSVRLVMDN